jgi:hypothetical protein
MPIDLPNLDDRTFADLVDEGRRLIPGFAPSWTDHNASDPGITFLELFASVAETLMYRVNRISEPNKRAFLHLLAPNRVLTPGWTVDQELSAAIRELRIEERAVTTADFERLCLRVPGVARAHCLPRRNLEISLAEALGHISILILCSTGVTAATVLSAVETDLQHRTLLTTKVHVLQPAALRVGVKLKLLIDADQLSDVVQARVVAALSDFFDPFTGGTDHQGWPFGEPIYRSDVYALLERVEGVDYVDSPGTTEDLFTIDAAAGDRRINSGTDWVGLSLAPGELVAFAVGQSTIDCQTNKLDIPT